MIAKRQAHKTVMVTLILSLTNFIFAAPGVKKPEDRVGYDKSKDVGAVAPKGADVPFDGSKKSAEDNFQMWPKKDMRGSTPMCPFALTGQANGNMNHDSLDFVVEGNLNDVAQVIIKFPEFFLWGGEIKTYSASAAIDFDAEKNVNIVSFSGNAEFTCESHSYTWSGFNAEINVDSF